MIGLRTGLCLGLRTGAAVGIGADPIQQPQASGGTTTQTVTVADSADPVISGGDAFSYTIQYTNTGGIAATSVSVATTLDASLTYVSSSGTGWTIGVVGQVVTATRATASVGAAPAITINVTTGGSQVTASTSAQATASNASTANGSQTTTVNLVSKDATAGIYLPASSTEWSNFITRKGLSVATPTSLYLLQEASGNPADSIGAFPLTAAGTGGTYQAAVAGWTRTAIKATDGATFSLTTTDAALPDVSTTSCAALAFVTMPASAPPANRNVFLFGTTTAARSILTTGPVMEGREAANITNGTQNPTGGVHPVMISHNHAATSAYTLTDQELITPTYSASVTGKEFQLFSGADFAGGYLYAVRWDGTNAEISSANARALLQAMGVTVAW